MKLILSSLVLIVAACSTSPFSSTKDDPDEPLEEVHCRDSGAMASLVRSSDDFVLGAQISAADCQSALSGYAAGVVCTKDLYPDRRGFAPTIVRYPRATGHTGTRDIETCNRMISTVNKMVMCSYSGPSLGWKTTRTYSLPGEPARYPHRFGASSPSLEECLQIAEGSLVVWEEDRLIHQTCRWGGSDWYPTCASDSDVQMNMGGGSVEQCLARIQTPNPRCSEPLNDELRLLKAMTEPEPIPDPDHPDEA